LPQATPSNNGDSGRTWTIDAHRAGLDGLIASGIGSVSKADVLVAQERRECGPAIVVHLRDSGFGVASAFEKQVPTLVRIHSFDAFLIAANEPNRIVRLVAACGMSYVSPHR